MRGIRRGRQEGAAAIAIPIGLAVLLGALVPSATRSDSSNVGPIPITTVNGPTDAGSTSLPTASSTILPPPVVMPIPAHLTASAPVTLSPGLILEQPSPVPVDVLGSTPDGLACDGPPLTLDGQPKSACGTIAPVMVTNNGGTDPGWTVTAQVSDFLDPTAPPTVSCDTPLTYVNVCIPGGDMGWLPQASVDSVVPGTSAQVEPGPLIDTSKIFAPGSIVSPPPGLNAAPQVLCQASAGSSQGQFTCGALIVLPVPASAAVPVSPGYEATLTVTLS